MNKEWSTINKEMQTLISEEATYGEGVEVLLSLRDMLMRELISLKTELRREQLYAYAIAVKESTDKIIKELSYKDIKRKISEQQKEELKSLAVVSEDDKAVWLIDYWCNKDVRGLIKMPLSRHWIMHIEAMLRISRKVGKSGK